MHRLCSGLPVQRINLRLFHQLNGRSQILRILIEGAQEDEDVVRPRSIDVVSFRHLASVTRRKHEHLATFASVRAGQADVPEEFAAVYRDGTLPEVKQDSLQPRRCFKDQRTIRTQIHVAEGVDHIRVGRRDQRLGIEPVFEDR